MSEGARAAQDYALKLLGHRARSEAELRGRLEAKGFAAAEIDQAIARLKELRFLDDAAFAADRAAALLGERGVGPEEAVRKLGAAGIDEPRAQVAIEQARAGAGEKELAERALEKRRPRVDAGSPRAARVRAARWLVGRGFSEESVRALLDLVDESAPE